MKRLLTVVVAAFAVPLAAQWLNYPTPGLPRTPDGKPNLSAPAPRTADGKPDLSGVWCSPAACDDNTPREFLNIGWSLKDGLALSTRDVRLSEDPKDTTQNRRAPYALSADRDSGTIHP